MPKVSELVMGAGLDLGSGHGSDDVRISGVGDGQGAHPKHTISLLFCIHILTIFLSGPGNKRKENNKNKYKNKNN